MKGAWWKITAVILLFYTLVGGLLLSVPRLDILNETIRNLYYHVPMWFGMILVLLGAMIYSIKYLRSNNLHDDLWASELTNTGILFGILGIVTGMIWAAFTWGEPWSNDPKQNAAAVGLLFYFAYLILRGSFKDDDQKAKISAIYNIFAFAVFIPLIFVLPRLTSSLHPGNGGNPGFDQYKSDSNLRLVFYPAIIGWTLLGVWFTQLRVRMKKAEDKILDID
ncbi:cytochrome c biogenesis protein [Flammeovirga yaeyamensis]|uniref:Cytochrome c biogenesis protein n=1 Tax=Flammeovirga yaeyamensis TaxID=367791 RepID=A0AAX1N5M5_9BACT|nr:MULTISPECIES: cytochrome c biogenesis protein CcsA [Flammeovirga]ANQ49792.1 cytochrome c biogenesis protein CcsA [Flammeovirga sp. MY04]MBB3697346.1 heme exporter protein C [Flammeovirga yaeyamensis]NMF36040.1 cytochrome c biogenesis protein CcsA [Flammeovirga yaeyamensis]QWG02775.1 cytochrome c biogenesis protein [Flammeovirga yaeyamensis]